MEQHWHYPGTAKFNHRFHPALHYGVLDRCFYSITHANALIRHSRTDRTRYEKSLIEMYETKKVKTHAEKIRHKALEFTEPYVSDIKIKSDIDNCLTEGLYAETLEYYGKSSEIDF